MLRNEWKYSTTHPAESLRYGLFENLAERNGLLARFVEFFPQAIDWHCMVDDGLACPPPPLRDELLPYRDRPVFLQLFGDWLSPGEDTELGAPVAIPDDGFARWTAHPSQASLPTVEERH